MKNEFLQAFFFLRPSSLNKPNCLETLRCGLEALLTCLRTFLSHLEHLTLGWPWLYGSGWWPWPWGWKVKRPTRGLAVTTIIISLWLIFIELQAWYRIVRATFVISDFDMTLTSNVKVNIVRLTRGQPNKKRSLGLLHMLPRYRPLKFR